MFFNTIQRLFSHNKCEIKFYRNALNKFGLFICNTTNDVIVNIERNLTWKCNIIFEYYTRYNDLTRLHNRFPRNALSFRRSVINLSHNYAAPHVIIEIDLRPHTLLFACEQWRCPAMFSICSLERFRTVCNFFVPVESCMHTHVRARTHHTRARTHMHVRYFFFFFPGAGVRDNRRICAVS